MIVGHHIVEFRTGKAELGNREKKLSLLHGNANPLSRKQLRFHRLAGQVKLAIKYPDIDISVFDIGTRSVTMVLS